MTETKFQNRHTRQRQVRLQELKAQLKVSVRNKWCQWKEIANNNLSNLQFDFHNKLPLKIKVKINLVAS